MSNLPIEIRARAERIAGDIANGTHGNPFRGMKFLGEGATRGAHLWKGWVFKSFADCSPSYGHGLKEFRREIRIIETWRKRPQFKKHFPKTVLVSVKGKEREEDMYGNDSAVYGVVLVIEYCPTDYRKTDAEGSDSFWNAWGEQFGFEDNHGGNIGWRGNTPVFIDTEPEFYCRRRGARNPLTYNAFRKKIIKNACRNYAGEW